MGKRTKRITRRVSTDEDEVAYREAKTRYYKAEEAVDAHLADQTYKCKVWLTDNFPDYTNPLAYWTAP